MIPQGTCRFCQINSGSYKYLDIDEPIAGNDDFIAVASIGALVEGWSLIMPRKHQLSMRNYYSTPLLGNLIESLLPILVQQYGPVMVFEHGANTEGSITSCGTDHAHLHLVPFGESLLLDMYGSGLNWIRCRSSEIASLTGESEYLFYSELGTDCKWIDPAGHLHILERPFSQFFRRLIAKKTIGDNMFDYKSNPNIEVSRKTRRALVSMYTPTP
ncbi:MAG: hypothetical protein M1147_06175 [Nitrospirae bacterium]|nr:hypothetical protein [Nitrospirota bacterium]MCL5977703.1 hypothetical protein [Nitrospirota bacterium]